MTEETSAGIEKILSCSPTSSRIEKPNRQQLLHDWDSESFIPSEQVHRQGRIRASSWDDSDDNLPPIPDLSGSKTCRIYTRDDNKPQQSVRSEINELKKQFFKTREKQEELEGSSLLERVREQLEANRDRRLSPARMRRRSKSSGSSSPVPEMESQVSPVRINTSSGSDMEFQEVSPKALQYDPTFYLNNFFTELRTKRISLVDPISVIESAGKEIPKYDPEIYHELSNLDGKEFDGYFCKTSRKLSQILEVEESRRDSEKNSEENTYSSNMFEKCFKQEEEFSPLETSRSKKSENLTENSENGKKQKEKYRSLSSEYITNFQKVQKPSNGSLSERSAKFFDRKLDDDFIGLSAKTGKTQLTSPKRLEDKDTNTTVQFFSVNSMDEGDNSFSQRHEDERNSDRLEPFKIDVAKKSANSTPRKSSDRSDRSHRTKSGKSRRSYNAESPKFMLNIGRDSARSLKVEDINDAQGKDDSEGSFRKSNSEKWSESKTDRIPPISLDSPSLESVISTRRSSKEQEAVTERSKGQSSTLRSHRKKSKQRSSVSLDSDTKEPSLTEATETQSPLESYRSGQKIPNTTRTSKGSAKSSKNDFDQEFEVTKTPNSISSKISKSSKGSPPKTTESKSARSPRSSKSRESSLKLDIPERAETRRASHRSSQTADAVRKDTGRPETRRSSHKQSERSSSSRSKNTVSRNSSPREMKSTPRINSGSSRRSKDSLESREEFVHLDSIEMSTRKENEKVCDAISNHSLASSVSRNSLKDLEVTNQLSYRSEISNREADDSMSAEHALKLSRSRNSSRTSVESNATEADISPARTTMKSRPILCTSCPPGIPPDEVPDQISARTNKSFIFEEDEDEEECLPTHRSKTGDESDRISNKRLSVINEVSVEDLETSQASNENVEKDTWDCRPCSRQASLSPEKISNEPEDEKWIELIKKFNPGSKSLILENNFPGFPNEKDFSWNSIESSQKKMADCECDGNSEDVFLLGNNSCEKSASIEKSTSENLRNLSLAHPNRLLDKPNKDFVGSIQSSQNIYYTNVAAGGSFGIGEFGDVTCWNAGDFCIKDVEKPKEHGDGMPRQRTSDILPLKPENRLSEVQRDEDFTNFIPCRLKKSKSDNCINRNVDEGSECQIPTETAYNNCKRKPGNFPEIREYRTNKKKYASKSTVNENSSADSLGSAKDWENLEFDIDRTPRLTRSLSNLDTSLQDSMYQRETSETLRTWQNDLFKRTSEVYKTGKDSTDLNVYLARKAKEDKIKSSNKWLKLRNSPKHGKKVKIKLRKKGSTSPKEPFHEHLSFRKSRSSIPTLKLRHPNCFQNFYKRFIGVFCLTSNSSAATSN